MKTKDSRRFTAERARRLLALQEVETARTMQGIVTGVLEEYHSTYVAGFITGTRKFASRLLKKAARREAALLERLTLAEKRAELAQVQVRMLADQNAMLMDRLGAMGARLATLERPWWRRIGRR